MVMGETERLLAAGGVESARFEARQIDLFTADPEKRRAMCARRISGEPLQYILGEWEFYSLPFLVGDGVLIPRADTETLCELALEWLKNKQAKVIDLCSGSGALAVAIAKNCPLARVWALEKSEKAYEYLEKNIKLHQADVTAVLGDVTKDTFGSFDLIISNPPYIKTADLDSLQREVHFEPQMALDGGEDGLYFYKEILNRWLPHLKEGGMMAVEIGYDQADAVRGLFINAGLSDVGSKRDLSGIERVIFGTLSSL